MASHGMGLHSPPYITGIVRGLSMIGQVVELCVLKATVGRLKDHNFQF